MISDPGIMPVVVAAPWLLAETDDEPPDRGGRRSQAGEHVREPSARVEGIQLRSLDRVGA